MTTREELRELRATIEAITGRRPVSENVAHLRRRLADLSKPTPVVAGGSMQRIVVLLDSARAGILNSMSAGTGQSPHDVIIRALDEHAVSRGLGAFVERAKKVKMR